MVRMSLVILALLLLGCSDATEPSPVMDARQILVRASMDLRGVRPSADELAILERDPSRLGSLVDGMLDDPRFGDRVRAIFAPHLRTRRDEYPLWAEDYGISEGAERFTPAVADETLNLIAHVAMADRPLSEILTADYTVVDEVLLAAWPLEPREQLPNGLVVARYTDGRPAAGILATNSFYWRHTSTVDNANRGRANAISRALLCEDYLERPIDFPSDVDLTNEEAIRGAIDHNPACQACHATLDPLADHLWGFMYLSEDAPSWSRYHPENERMWQDYVSRSPAFFGTPSDGSLATLAQHIARDERFVGCMVRRVYEGILGRDAVLADEGQLASHRERFLASGLSLRALVRGIVRDPAYRGESKASAFGGTPAPVTMKMASPEMLSSALHALTGERLTLGGRDLTSVDYGLRALGGGSESGPSADPSLGHVLVQRRLAEGLASRLVSAPNDSPVGRMLAQADLSREPPPDVLRALSLAIRSSSTDDPALANLWRSIEADAGPTEAWVGLLTALFADPAVALY